MVTVETKHPAYIEHFDEWMMMRDAVRGEAVIREGGTRYLPKPSGFLAQADTGTAMYNAYKFRARYPELVARTLRGMVGLIHRTEAQINMPDVMMPIWEKATLDGLPLEAFHRRVTWELLLTSRYGILTDVEEGKLPTLAGYTTESITNWDDDRSMFVLDESGMKRDGFQWKEDKRFRVLTLDGQYVQQVYGSDLEKEGEEVRPAVQGGGVLSYIPMVITNSRDLSMNIVEPPLIGVARAALAVYQLDADYRHQLYMTGQDTLFVIGSDEDLPRFVGAGVVHGLPAGADAKYIGTTGTGIAAHRVAIQDGMNDAISAGASLFDQQSGQESGEALRIRYAAQTATLTTIALTSAQALEASLRNVALFLGQDPASVVVKPNLQFTDAVLSPQDAQALMALWLGGAVSKQTLYDNLQRGEIASAERSFEEEEELISTEAIDTPVPGNSEKDLQQGV